MSPDNQSILAGLLLLTAIVAAFAAVIVWRRSSRASLSMRSVTATLDARLDLLPITFAGWRAGLAERGATAEHATWSLKRLDTRVEDATQLLRERRAALAIVQAQLAGARSNVHRLKAAMQAVSRAIELRRAILG